MAQGQLPPGVVAMPPGMAPPGAIPLGPVGQHMPQPGSKKQYNPLPDGPEGVTILRKLSQCPIPGEANKLQSMLQPFLGLDDRNVPPETLKEMDDAFAKGVHLGITANRHCNRHRKTRVVVAFDRDEKLKGINDRFLELEKKALQLKAEFEKTVEEAQKTLNERWHTAVKTKGLDPDRKFYQINEENRTIEEVELRCDECTEALELTVCRETTERLIKEQEEKSDDQ